MLFGTLYLGDNEITDCQQALVVEGTEVFRLRERTHDDQLVVDFDVRNQAGARLAKIAKNHVVYIAEHVESRSRPKLYEIVSRGDVLASVEEVSPTTVRVMGRFWVDGLEVVITKSGLRVGSKRISGCQFFGSRKAIVLTKDTITLGS